MSDLVGQFILFNALKQINITNRFARRKITTVGFKFFRKNIINYGWGHFMGENLDVDLLVNELTGLLTNI